MRMAIPDLRFSKLWKINHNPELPCHYSVALTPFSVDEFPVHKANKYAPLRFNNCL